MTAEAGLAEVNQLATETAVTAWAWAGDFLIVILLFTALFMFAWYFGKGPFAGLLLSFYVGYAVYALFPYLSLLPSAPAQTALAAHLALFASLTLLAQFIIRRIAVSDFLYVGVIGIIILSLLGACFLLALAYHVFPVQEVYTFTPAIDALFAPKEWFFWWFVAPLIGLLLLAR